ncbi:hypothetical protein K493DRAFT_301319 [Basidiobolus meristosporus CBS 931.73]|uniref:Uncharacterized protein n=1 Tax=Basidiobolus meristosporus CBS 931.73 TaxID=1314790 RepID=A0A1Y1YCJ2_9FUNG|nr:hypothetical protein K493DRAFT_307690 [Basidiobolus meristosporus CBS 931.73]ORX95719.1 hypothetical protein K493DRAFT_301319 [Basidiobolus meristosporus CBS 931.73]|eukprot:ORX83089.1 hypothetical protein K493DRAFT_307690 [Basidiobolus meristosporus CBS 931.73]
MHYNTYILSTLVFLAGASYASPIDTYNNQTPYLDSTESYSSTDYPSDVPDASPLLDSIEANSAQDAQALSNSNQYDQVQLVDQTLFQPSTPTYVQSPIPDEDEDKYESDDYDQLSCSRCERRRYRY